MYIFALSMNKFIHQSIVVYMAFIMLLKMMAMPLSLLDYSLNKNFIAANLCENRSKTAMHCAGRCYLNKQLTRANDNQEPQDAKGNIKILIIDFFEPVNNPSFGCLAPLTTHANPFPAQRIDSHYMVNIFHPPIA
jgi:hypothetical protein